MGYFNVTYDLIKKEESEYQELWDELDRLDSVKYQDSAYLVDSSDTQKELLTRLEKYIHENDRLMITEFTKRPSWTRALKGTSAWLDARF
jgi:hypothetical protein